LTNSCTTNSWIVGFINSAPYIAICLLYETHFYVPLVLFVVDSSLIVSAGLLIRLTIGLAVEV
jgi:hypothetical protein